MAGILSGPTIGDPLSAAQDRKSLAQKMRPIVHQELANAGAMQSFQNLAEEYRSLPLVGGALDVDLTGQVVTYAEKAIFAYLGKKRRSGPTRWPAPPRC